MLAPHPDTSAPAVGATTIDEKRATVRMIAAVTGGSPDNVGDVFTSGCFASTLATRVPKVCLGHQWDTPIGRVVEIKELPPGDPGLPRTTGSGRPWSPECGALVATARINTAIPAGRDALEMIKFFGPEESCWSVGYKAVRSRRRGGVRYIDEARLYEISPVLFGAHDDARGLPDEAKSAHGRRGGYERKAVPAGVSMPVHTGKRWALTCENCGLPVALADRPLPEGTRMFCSECVESVGRLVDPFAARDLDVTSEQAYADALDEEQDWWADGRGEMRRGPRG